MKHVVLDTLALLLNAHFDAKQADAQVRMVGMLTDHHATREDLQALEVKLEAKIDGTRKDLEAKIAQESNKLTWRMFGMNVGLMSLLFAALKLWPEASV